MNKLFLTAAAAFAVASMPAHAVITFVGQDDGAVPGDSFTNSAAAEAAFKAAAAAYGGVKTEGFESAALGYYSPLALDGLTITYQTQNMGPGFSGVTNVEVGGARYGFNITEGGANWLGFPDMLNSAATFTFDKPTNSLGFYITGVQDIYTSSLTLEQLDGSLQTIELPINIDGGVAYFGVIDSVGFTAVYISQGNHPGYADAWGVDDISYNTGIVPEPATWAMLIAGFGLVGASLRRRKAVRA